MSIRSMGERSALRSAQESNRATAGPVVAAIGTTTRESDSATDVQPVSESVQAPPAPAPPNPVREYLDSVVAWIPTEAVALFVTFSGFFSVFDDTAKELVLAAVVALFTVIYAVQASGSAQRNRQLPQSGRQKPAVKTAAIALVAFLAWWIATPGSFATDKTELGWDPFYPAVILAIAALGLPLIARASRVEPLGGKGK